MGLLGVGARSSMSGEGGRHRRSGLGVGLRGSQPPSLNLGSTRVFSEAREAPRERNSHDFKSTAADSPSHLEQGG